VPWPNWATVDLRSYSIDAGAPFAVGFVISRYDSPAVMVTKYPGQNPYHSFTYMHHPSSGGPPNWYYLGVYGSDSIWIYLIRAYVSYIPVGVKEVVELLPSSFDLKQNYPNPFSARGGSAYGGNPSTVISYQLPVSSDVTLRVYDVLGREVATLVNGRQGAGTHSVAFDASNLPSGVYLYRLSASGGPGVAEDFTQVRKMVVIR